jgi:adenylate cyclase
MGKLKPVSTDIEKYGMIEKKLPEDIGVYGVIEKGIKEDIPPETHPDIENEEQGIEAEGITNEEIPSPPVMESTETTLDMAVPPPPSVTESPEAMLDTAVPLSPPVTEYTEAMLDTTIPPPPSGTESPEATLDTTVPPPLSGTESTEAMLDMVVPPPPSVTESAEATLDVAVLPPPPVTEYTEALLDVAVPPPPSVTESAEATLDVTVPPPPPVMESTETTLDMAVLPPPPVMESPEATLDAVVPPLPPVTESTEATLDVAVPPRPSVTESSETTLDTVVLPSPPVTESTETTLDTTVPPPPLVMESPEATLDAAVPPSPPIMESTEATLDVVALPSPPVVESAEATLDTAVLPSPPMTESPEATLDVTALLSPPVTESTETMLDTAVPPPPPVTEYMETMLDMAVPPPPPVTESPEATLDAVVPPPPSVTESTEAIHDTAVPLMPPQPSAIEIRAQKVKFSIGVKLVSIISALMVVSLGSMTVFGTLMIGKDVRLTAEDSNYSINRRAALSAQNMLETVYNDTLLLLNTLTMLNNNDLLTEKRNEAVDFFFRNNRDISAICVSDSVYRDAEGKQLFVNRAFMVANRLTSTQVSDYINTQVEATSLARDGEFFVLNVTPSFGVDMLEMLFPWKNGEIESAVSVFFSIEGLKEIFSDSVNHSFIINGTGDVLVDPDLMLVRAGVNLRNKPFIKEILEGGSQNIQSAYEDEDGVNLVAYQRLSLGNVVVVTVISSKEVFKGVVSTTWRNILLSAGVLLLSILFILLFARHLSKPLKELTKAAGLIESGFYHINILPKNKDEIGILSYSFNSMSRGLLSFEKFTNKSLANLARSGKLVTGGVDRKATMFFSDIRGFTAISEKLKPDEIVEFLNDYLDRMVACVNATGGVVDKFIGDAVMAHWGAVESSGNLKRDALNCVKAALMMRASLRSFNAGRGGDKKPVIKIGCGINSGSLVAGQIGSDQRLEYTVIGDTVSFADRVETFNKPFGTEILISESTWKLCGEFLITEEMPSVMEKGRRVRVFAVINTEDPDEVDDMLKLLDAMPKNVRRITRQCIGASGPQTLADVRTMLGIATPDLSKVNTDEEEKKYNIQQQAKPV